MAGRQLDDAVAQQRSAHARAALDDLVEALQVCIDELQDARHRADELRKQHDDGRGWLDIVTAETPPLIVERISVTLDALSSLGSRWRRAEAWALYAEGASINRIAALFGVTRQRISTLLRSPPPSVDGIDNHAGSPSAVGGQARVDRRRTTGPR